MQFIKQLKPASRKGFTSRYRKLEEDAETGNS